MDAIAPILMAEKRKPVPPKRRAPPALIDEATGLPVPMARQRTPLKTLEHVKAELGRVYRGMKAGSIPPEDGTKRAYVLGALGKVIEMADLERRLDVLEKQQKRFLPGAIGPQAND